MNMNEPGVVFSVRNAVKPFEWVSLVEIEIQRRRLAALEQEAVKEFGQEMIDQAMLEMRMARVVGSGLAYPDRLPAFMASEVLVGNADDPVVEEWPGRYDQANDQNCLITVTLMRRGGSTYDLYMLSRPDEHGFFEAGFDELRQEAHVNQIIGYQFEEAK